MLYYFWVSDNFLLKKASGLFLWGMTEPIWDLEASAFISNFSIVWISEDHIASDGSFD
jgi:hypothetical protein